MNKMSLIIVVLIISYTGKGQTAQEYFESGLNDHCINSYNSAINKFDDAVILNPMFTEAFFLRGSSKAKLN